MNGVLITAFILTIVLFPIPLVNGLAMTMGMVGAKSIATVVRAMALDYAIICAPSAAFTSATYHTTSLSLKLLTMPSRFRLRSSVACVSVLILLGMYSNYI